MHIRFGAMAMIASLPMYDRPELSTAHGVFWAGIHKNLADVEIKSPSKLDQSAQGLAAWLSPNLCFSQTCGRPYKLHLRAAVTLIGTPDYGLAGCPAGHYRSVLIARKDDRRATLSDFNGAVLAYNETMSQSGFAAVLHCCVQDDVDLAAGLHTGAHLASIAAVQDGRADLAGIDALTWEFFCQFTPTDSLKIIGYSMPTPTLPYITRVGQDAAAYADAIRAAIHQMPANARAMLRLKSLVQIAPAAYSELYEPTPNQLEQLSIRNGNA